jgi:hypothetical protein
MRVRSVCTALATALVVALAGSSTASAAVSLPTAHCGTVAGTNCLQFDNFTVYSLALLNLQAGAGSGNINPGDPFYVKTSGNLANALVVGTGELGTRSINAGKVGPGLVDDAYHTPNAGTNNLTNFATNQNVGAANSTQGAQGINIPNNSANTWDVSVNALLTYLNGGNLVFFFNLNQTNSTPSYLNNNQDALGWLSATLTNSTTHASQTFYLDGDACNGVLGAPNSPNCDPSQAWGDVAGQTNANNNILTDQSANHDDWAYIHGQICADQTTGAVLGFGACTGQPNGVTINQNLGANTAAFGLFSAALQQALLSGNYDKLSVDFRMAAENNGYEQLIIESIAIPEPITVMLFGGGLVLLTSLRRRKMKVA